MSEERTNMAIRDLKHYVIDNMSLDVQDDFEIICKYIINLQQKVEQLEKENKELKQQELTMSYDSRLFYLKQRCEYLERSNNRREDEIMELRDENVDLVSKNNQLENIRKEATEYNYKLQENYSHRALFEDKIAVNVYKVAEENLNILNKGSNK